MYVQTAVYPFEPERKKGEGAMREKKGERGRGCSAAAAAAAVVATTLIFD